MRVLSILLLGLLAASGAPRATQAPPATEVYLAPLSVTTSGVTVGTPVNISNNPGYDNQPSFLPDGSVLFTSNRDAKQTDIYRYDPKTKLVAQATHTDENEYSPLVTPDGKTFSVVRGADQKLWRFNLDGSNPELVYAHTGLIGYHVWIDARHLAVFVLGAGQGQPATLQLVDLATSKAEVIDTNIGRSLLVRPGMGTVSYVSKADPAAWMIKEFDPKTNVTRPVVKTPERSEDSAWTPDGRLMMARGSALLSWRPGETDWTTIADLASAGLTGITRLAVSRDGHWIAIVAMPKS